MGLDYFYKCNDEKADYDKDDYIRKYKTLGKIKSLKGKIVSLNNYRKVLLRDSGNIY